MDEDIVKAAKEEIAEGKAADLKDAIKSSLLHVERCKLELADAEEDLNKLVNMTPDKFYAERIAIRRGRNNHRDC